MKKLFYLLSISILLITGCNQEEEYDGKIRFLNEDAEPHLKTFNTGDTIKVDLVHELYQGELDFVEIKIFRHHKDIPGKITSLYDLQTFYPSNQIDTIHYEFIVPSINYKIEESQYAYFNAKASGHGRRTGINASLKGLGNSNEDEL